MPRLTGATLATLRAQASLQVRSRAARASAVRAARAGGRPRPGAPAGALRRATCSSTSRAIPTGARTASSTCSAPATRRTASGATGRCGRPRAPRRSARSSSGWTGSRLGWPSYPDLHVFHFNAYEPTALKQLVARHAVGEYELDELLRRKVLVDLYGISRQAIRAGVESYGLKALEPVYRLRAGRRAARRDRLAAALAGVAGRRRPGASRRHRGLQRGRLRRDARAVPLAARPAPRGRGAVRRHARRARARAAQAARRQARRVPRAARGDAAAAAAPVFPTTSPRTRDEQRAVRTTFDLLGYHSREAKPAYWALYARREKTLDAAARRGRRGARRPRGDRRDDRGQAHHLADARSPSRSTSSAPATSTSRSPSAARSCSSSMRPPASRS